ncbi:MAG: hypothetical protein FWD76_00540 [Firmicutes bacterium]|nr:hypothetical protein [Bacillota bacterium]
MKRFLKENQNGVANKTPPAKHFAKVAIALLLLCCLCVASVGVALAPTYQNATIQSAGVQSAGMYTQDKEVKYTHIKRVNFETWYINYNNGISGNVYIRTEVNFTFTSGGTVLDGEILSHDILQTPTSVTVLGESQSESDSREFSFGSMSVSWLTLQVIASLKVESLSDNKFHFYYWVYLDRGPGGIRVSTFDAYVSQTEDGKDVDFSDFTENLISDSGIAR